MIQALFKPENFHRVVILPVFTWMVSIIVVIAFANYVALAIHIISTNIAVGVFYTVIWRKPLSGNMLVVTRLVAVACIFIVLCNVFFAYVALSEVFIK